MAPIHRVHAPAWPVAVPRAGLLEARGRHADRVERVSIRRVTSRPASVVVVAAMLVLVGCRAPAVEDAPEPAAPRPEPDAAPEEPEPALPPDDPEPEPDDADDADDPPPLAEPVFEEFAVPAGTHPHDVAPGPDGRVWYTGQHTGELGVLDPETGDVEVVALGTGSAPHGVIVDDDGVPWITDGGLNAIVKVDPDTNEVTTFPLPRFDGANLNTASFDGDGRLWFTGQTGAYGKVDPASGDVEVYDAPRGRGPYGIATTPDGTVWFSSLAGSYIARITTADGDLEVVDVPSPDGGARRVWSDSVGRLWVTEWFVGSLAVHDPADGSWQTWRLPGDDPQPYAVYVDEDDLVWVTDFGGDALVRFDPETEEFDVFLWPTAGAQVRQLLGRPGEIWGAGSGTDTLVVLRTR